LPGVADYLILTDPLQSVGISALQHAVDRLLEDLRQAGWVHVVLHKIRRRHVAHLLCHAVAEGVVDHCNRAAVHRHKVVLRVVGEGLAAGGERVAVGVVGLWREPVVEVEAGEADRGDAGQRGRGRGAVAHRIERVVDLAVAARLVVADGLAGEPVDAVVVPGERAAGLLRRAGAVARGAEGVAIARHRRGVWRRRVERGEAVEAVVLDGGLQLVGIGDGDQVAGRVVGVGGGVTVGGQVVVHHRAEPVEAVVGVGHGRAMHAGRVDRSNIARHVVGVVQRALRV